MTDHPYEPVECPVVVARFSSRCSLCDTAIIEGEEIAEHEGDWLHLSCLEEHGL